MKLHQQVTEGVGVPITVQMNLAEIIRDGKVTNNYQIFVLGWVSEFFKDGVKLGAELNGPITAGSNATSSETVAALKALTPEDQVNLATYLLDCIKAGESALKQPNSSIIDWSRFVLAKQD